MSIKRFAKHAAVYALGNVGLRAAALLLTPVYTYCLSVPEFGLWATLQISMQLMLILMTVGMRDTCVRFARDSQEDARTPHLLGTATLIVLAGGAAVTAAVLLWLLPFFRSILHRDDVLGLTSLACLGALMQSLCVELMSFYRATNRPARYMAAGLFGALLLLVLTFVAVYSLRLGVFGALWAYTLAYALLFLAVAADIGVQHGYRFSRGMVPGLMAFGAPLALSAAGQMAIYGASIYPLSHLAGLETVAVFSLGWRFATMMSVGVTLPFQLAFQPFLYGNLKDPQVNRNASRLLTYLMLTTVATSFGLILASYLLIPIVAPPAYADAFLVALLLLPGQAFLGLHYFGETLLGAVRRTRILGVLNALGAAVCVALSFLLIPGWGWLGAVAASTVAAVAVNSLVLGIGLRQFRLAAEVEWGRVVVLGLAFGAQLLIAAALRNAHPAVFLGATTLFFLGSAGLVCLGPFSTSEERRLLKGAAGRIGALLSPRVPSQ